MGAKVWVEFQQARAVVGLGREEFRVVGAPVTGGCLWERVSW